MEGDFFISDIVSNGPLAQNQWPFSLVAISAFFNQNYQKYVNLITLSAKIAIPRSIVMCFGSLSVNLGLKMQLE